MSSPLLRFDGTVKHDRAIDLWFHEHNGKLGDIARTWFELMRACGDEVCEVLHDGCPNACFGDVPFGYVNVYSAHVNVGFFQGVSLRDPKRMLQGAGKLMRHVKLKPGVAVDDEALRELIAAAYAEMKARVEAG